MILVFDIGNTNIVIGLFKEEVLINKWRIVSDNQKSVDDYAIDLVELFLTNKIDCLQVTGAIIASVVPSLTAKVLEAVKKFTNCEVLVVGEDLKLNIDVLVKNKGEVGADRLINSIAAYKKFGGNLIVIDFGTATTFDVVGGKGEYLGGVIAPGINLSLKALHDMTAKLPKISVKKQNHVIGKNTVEAMNSGVYFGYISLVEGMIKRIEEEHGHKTIRIITGGLAEIFKDALNEIIDHHEPDLTLSGLLLAYLQNQ
ncbi:MAG: type III pantothenate kinase [Rickettsiales bacterium]|nr:type III pantothenate kinase [Rickettsiales bacterium]